MMHVNKFNLEQQKIRERKKKQNKWTSASTAKQSTLGNKMRSQIFQQQKNEGNKKIININQSTAKYNDGGEGGNKRREVKILWGVLNAL